MIDELLGPELQQVPDALVVPLGRSVEFALDRLVKAGALDAAPFLAGFPYPSGTNGHRHRQFAENRDALRRQVADWFAG